MTDKIFTSSVYCGFDAFVLAYSTPGNEATFVHAPHYTMRPPQTPEELTEKAARVDIQSGLASYCCRKKRRSWSVWERHQLVPKI